MATVFAKLNLKDHKQIVVLDAPSSFERELAALEGVEVIRDLKKAKQVTFSLAFVTTPEQIDALHRSSPLRRKAAQTLHDMAEVPITQGDLPQLRSSTVKR